MNSIKTASSEAKRIRRREAKQNRITAAALAVCGVVTVLCDICAAERGGCGMLWSSPAYIAGNILYLLSYSSLLTGAFTIGMLPEAAAGALVALTATVWNVLRGEGSRLTAWLLRAALTPFFLLAVVFAVISIAMLIGSFAPAKGKERYTVVVLGCRLKGSRPGRMLRRRLDAAIRYLRVNPDTPCIVSGGQGDDEEASEAEVMAEYLSDHGIESTRIFLEDSSATTYENIRFSKALAQSRSLPMSFAVATDRFHQLRARLICRDNGIVSRCINAETAPHLVVQYWSREVMCIIEKYLKKL